MELIADTRTITVWRSGVFSARSFRYAVIASSASAFICSAVEPLLSSAVKLILIETLAGATAAKCAPIFA